LSNPKQDVWERRIWFVSAATIVLGSVFSYGFWSGKTQAFPYALIRRVVHTTESLRRVYDLEVRSERPTLEIAVPYQSGGVVTYREGRVEPGPTFVTMYRNGAYGAFLIDPSGEVIHEWTVPWDTAPELKPMQAGVKVSAHHRLLHGAQLLPGGDVVVSFENWGMMRLNWDSRLKWVSAIPTHHAVAVDEDGSIWTLTRERVADASKRIHNLVLPYWDDQVVRFSPDGEILERFSLLEVILRNAYEGILYAGEPREPRIDHDDPLHANDIDILSAGDARRLAGIEAGDIMVSMRTIDTVIIIDRSTHAIKWSQTGPFLRQHDPDFGADGALWVFDNRTSVGNRDHFQYLTEPQAFGYSRVLEIDPVTRQVLWVYQGRREEPFYTSIMGKLQPLPNGNVLMVEAEGGRVIEVERASKEIVWEFINLLEPGFVGQVSEAVRIAPSDLPGLTGRQE
jgi:Arylsulfotransferase (ASST)